MENSSDYIQKIIDEINDHLLYPEKTKVHLKIFGFYNSLNKLIDHCSKNPDDTKISLQLNELWYVVEDLHNGIVFRRYLRPDENGSLWEYEVDPDDQKILNSKKLGKYELSRDDKIILEAIEREEERINNERKKMGIAEPFKTHGIHIGDFTKREKYNIHSRLDSFMNHEKWAYDRRDSFCQNITTIYQRFENLRLPRTAHLKYEDYVAKIASSAYTLSNPDKQPMNLESTSSNENTKKTWKIELFNLLTPDVFDYTDIDEFYNDLFIPQKLKIKNQCLAWTFCKFGYNNITNDDTLHTQFKAVFKAWVRKKSGNQTKAEKKLKKDIEKIIKNQMK